MIQKAPGGDSRAAIEALREVGWPGLAVTALVGFFLITLFALYVAWRWLGRHEERVLALFGALGHWLRSLPGVHRLRERHPELWRFLARRLTPAQYLGLHLTLGLLVGAAALLAFTVTATDVVEEKDIVQFDQRLAAVLHAHATAGGIAFFETVSALGSPPVLTALGVAVALALGFARRWYQLAGWGAALVGALLLTLGLKQLFERPRPAFADAVMTAPLWAFPSGHAMVSLVAYGMLAYLLAKATRRPVLRWLATAAAGSLVLLIGAGRLYLGVHYFSDVVAGYTVGVVWLTACATGIAVVTGRATHRGRAAHR